jgi:hypothetical protein
VSGARSQPWVQGCEPLRAALSSSLHRPRFSHHLAPSITEPRGLSLAPSLLRSRPQGSIAGVRQRATHPAGRQRQTTSFSKSPSSTGRRAPFRAW